MTRGGTEWVISTAVYEMAADALAALPASPQPKPDSAWLIERHYASELHYWTGRFEHHPIWSTNHEDALRFARRQDAEAMLTWHCEGIGRVVEHLWPALPASPARPEEEKVKAERALALKYALALMRDRIPVEAPANAARIQQHIYRLLELVAERSDLTAASPARARLMAFVKEKAAKARADAKCRRDMADAWRGGTDEDHRAAHRMAEQQSGRPIKFQSAKQRAQLAERDERIAQQHDEEADLYAALLVQISEEGRQEEQKPADV